MAKFSVTVEAYTNQIDAYLEGLYITEGNTTIEAALQAFDMSPLQEVNCEYEGYTKFISEDGDTAVYVVQIG